MRKLSKLKINTVCDIEINFNDTLESTLEKLNDYSVKYEMETVDYGTKVIVDVDNEYCTHELNYDTNGKFLGFFTDCADGTDEYDNGIEILFDDGNTFRGTLGEWCNELCEGFIKVDTIQGLFGGDIGVNYSDETEAVDNNKYVVVISEMRDSEEIIAIIRKDKLVDFGMIIDDVDIVKEIMKEKGE